MTEIINSWFVGSNSRKAALTLYKKEQVTKQPLLIFAHGFKGFKDWGHFPLLCSKIVEKGIAVLAFNFTHNGGTVTNPIDFPDLEAFSQNTYSKEVNDIEQLFKWIKEHQEKYFNDVDVENSSILGHSRGGGTVLIASKRIPQIKKVITWAAVASFEERLPSQEELTLWKETGVRIIKNGRTKQDMPMRYDFIEDFLENTENLKIESAVRKLNKPLLVIHGKQDETVPVNHATRIAEWGGADATLLLIEECNHTFQGMHPWTEKNLPHSTQKAIEATVQHILN